MSMRMSVGVGVRVGVLAAVLGFVRVAGAQERPPGPGVAAGAAGRETASPAAPAQGDAAAALSKFIWCVYQARNGDYWFASDGEGVYRYAAGALTQFTTKHGLIGNRIRDIQEDKAGNIYITALEGLSRFDGRTFTTLTPVDSTDWKLQPGDMWFKGDSSQPGVFRYDGATLYRLQFPKHPLEDEFYKTHPRMPWSPVAVYTIYTDRNGFLWFGTAALGACRFDGKSHQWLLEDHLTNTPAGGSFGIRSIVEDKAGKFWICNTRYRFDVPGNAQPEGAPPNGMLKYTKAPGVAGIKSEDGDYVYYMSAVEHNGDLWFGTGGAVLRYDGAKTAWYPVTDDGKPVAFFRMSKDNQGAMWLGTNENGAYRFNGTAFEKFKP